MTVRRSNPTISQKEKVDAATLDGATAREEFLKVAEIAARLRVTPMTVYRAIDNGDFPGTIRIRDSIRVPVAAYDAYVAGSVIVSTEVLALTPDDVDTLLEALEGHSQIRVRAVRDTIAAFAEGLGLLVRRHEATP